jgi:NAD(P)-dependent dehydrogenase (short-subunit alcohol dehydrogenase family)
MENPLGLSQTTVLITGSTDGVGKLIAKRSAVASARVLVHGRSDVKGRDTLGEIQREAPRSDVEYYRADLASLDDVRRLADEVKSQPTHPCSRRSFHELQDGYTDCFSNFGR